MKWLIGVPCALLLVACGEDPDPPRPVDETGYMTASLLHYTAAQTLGSAPVDVAVVGLAGAIRRSGGDLDIRKSSDATSSVPFVQANASSGMVDVDLGQLASPDPPYVVLNSTASIPVYAPTVAVVFSRAAAAMKSAFSRSTKPLEPAAPPNAGWCPERRIAMSALRWDSGVNVS